MIAKGLLQEVAAELRRGEEMWCETGDGHGPTLVATDAGLAAIGIEPEDANTAPRVASDAPAPDTATEPQPAPKTHTPCKGARHAILIAKLRAPVGAIIESRTQRTFSLGQVAEGAGQSDLLHTIKAMQEPFLRRDQ
jgi:hypothetical protein